MKKLLWITVLNLAATTFAMAGTTQLGGTLVCGQKYSFELKCIENNKDSDECSALAVINRYADSKKNFAAIGPGSLKGLKDAKQYFNTNKAHSKSQVHGFNRSTTLLGKVIIGPIMYPVTVTRDLSNLDEIRSAKKINNQKRKEFLSSVDFLTNSDFLGQTLEIEKEVDCWAVEDFASSLLRYNKFIRADFNTLRAESKYCTEENSNCAFLEE